MGLKIITDISEQRTIIFEGCLGDSACVAVCPENALAMAEEGDDFPLTIDLALCDGVACRRC
jgi:NAD-dependent dihydropyrimidine dehydrogenase PreA subunit